MNLSYHINNFLRGKKHIRTYSPVKKNIPKNLIEINSAWKGLELIIEDILNRFSIGRESCIEFGVEYGYSSVALSNYFKKVIGVDTFEGDEHTGHKGDHFLSTQKQLSSYSNIDLFKSDYRDWIIKDKNHYDFSHVDIVHNYKETFECGLWAAQHSECTIFHDTESFLAVRKAVIDIAKATGKELYNYPYHHGLGILVNAK